LPLDQDNNLTVQGVHQNSNVASLTGTDTIGRGDIIGTRVNWTLPQEKDFLHSLSLGLDYKHMFEHTETYTLVSSKKVLSSFTLTETAIDYYPMSLAYSASWVKKKSFTDLNAGINMHFRGMGSENIKFDDKRYNADGSYIYFKGDLTHTHDLPGGMEVMAKVQGQLSNHPLVNSEQFAAGGQSTVRGYLESEALADNGVVGTLELRSPSFIGTKKDDSRSRENEWRVYAFLEGGTLSLNDPLPEQTSHFELASVGIGTHLKLHEHFNGSLDVSMPLIDQGTTLGGDLFVSFRIWADF
ncbi:MAG: hemin-binding protein, partial [Verrucomicrobiaceae bacterium]|nr:hemin-binding protein [Verrucomicrobiaceae bacterium]